MWLIRRVLAAPFWLAVVVFLGLTVFCGQLVRWLDPELGHRAAESIFHGLVRGCGEMAFDLQERVERLDRLRRQVEAYEARMATIAPEDFLVALHGGMERN